jgi:hypothetical protein
MMCWLQRVSTHAMQYRRGAHQLDTKMLWERDEHTNVALQDAASEESE